MTEVLQKQTAIDLFRDLPAIEYNILFISSRILKGITAIEEQIIPRCPTSDYPKESFIIAFQNMGKAESCNALVYIRGSKQNDSGYWCRTHGRAQVHG